MANIFYISQLAFEEDLRLLIRSGDVTHKLQRLTKPTTVNEFERIISTVDDYVLCPGGPHSTQYSSVISKCCYKDGDYWRHRKCAQIVNKEVKVCIPCRSIHSRLNQAITRQSFIGKAKIFDDDTLSILSPHRLKNVVRSISKRYRNQRKKIDLRDNVILGLRSKLEEQVEKMKAMSD